MSDSGTRSHISNVFDADAKKLEACIAKFEKLWAVESPPDLAQFIKGLPFELNSELFAEILAIDIEFRRELELPHDLSWYRGCLSDEPLCHVFNEIEKGELFGLTVKLPSSKSDAIAEDYVPEIDARFQVEDRLGAGSYGAVFSAQDRKLQRKVAVKVSASRSVADSSLREARMLARLSHPNIAPIYDVGLTVDGRLYLIMKLYSRGDLSKDVATHYHERGERAIASNCAQLLDALQHAHSQHITHRDLKPHNILLDDKGQFILTDFGLAIEDDEIGDGSGYAGTLAYMSPEQARGESHRIDGRADIFSIGVILYELLTGVRPFRSSRSKELIHQILYLNPKPPRQYRSEISPELERICTRALEKRASDRYSTASDMAEELRSFLEQPQRRNVDREQAITPRVPATSSQVVPKGVRSFDQQDSEFFLQLLPGPLDSYGTPQSVRFWKGRIEDVELPFSVGVIHGPSGCGKTSLVRAGLIPLLNADIRVVYLPAHATQTERRLLDTLREVGPVDLERGLASTARQLRDNRTDGISKTLIIIDQFEQWLYGREVGEDPELVHALRQCDGKHLQCILMVRDDFWLETSRFMHALEVPLVEGENNRFSDLFSQQHAEHVLKLYGQAYGMLPSNEANLTSSQTGFLKAATESLAVNGRIYCIRLSVFAQMLKDEPWELETLRRHGGAEGVGEQFLERAFHGGHASPEHRRYAEQCSQVLGRLLPRAGRLKGGELSMSDLQEITGLPSEEFQIVLRILDQELRLITPVQLQSTEPTGGEVKAYQLTHDYLVPSLRSWLGRKQRATARGRAELLLEERAALWENRKDRKQLPTVSEHLRIRALTMSSRRTRVQKEMLRSAAKLHSLVAMLLVALLCTLGYGFSSLRQYIEARSYVARVKAAESPESLRRLIAQRDDKPGWEPVLREELANKGDATKEYPNQLFKLRMLESKLDLKAIEELLPLCQERWTSSLIDRLENEELPEAALEPFVARLWKLLVRRNVFERSSVNVALMLAHLDSENTNWNAENEAPNDFSRRLEEKFALVLREQDRNAFLRATMEIRAQLRVFASSFSQYERARFVLDNFFETRGAEDTGELDVILEGTDLVTIARVALYLDEISKDSALATNSSDVWDLIRQSHMRSLDAFEQQKISSTGEDAETEQLKQLTAIGNTSYLMCYSSSQGRLDKLLELLADQKYTDARSRAIELLQEIPLAGDRLAAELQAAFRAGDEKSKPALLMGLIVSLKECEPATWKQILPTLKAQYRAHPHSGVHGAIDWLLRTRGEELPILQAADNPSPHKGYPTWYMDELGQSMIVLSEDDVNKSGSDRWFSIASRETTHTRYAEFAEEFKTETSVEKPYVYGDSDGEKAQAKVLYDHAIAYCNWLTLEAGMSKAEQCYEEIDASATKSGKGDNESVTRGSKFRLKPNAGSLGGFRLPTATEWTYACQGGTEAKRYFGNSPHLLTYYCWYVHNTPSIKTKYYFFDVGLKMPNPFGGFDFFGNVMEWCEWGTSNEQFKDGYVFTKGAASTAHPANVEFSQEHAYGLLNDKVPAGIRIVRTYSKDGLSN